MRRRAALVAEDRVLAVLAPACVTQVPAVQVALEPEPPVPATRGLEKVPAERAHRAELRRRRERARLAQHLGDLGIHLELGERRCGADNNVLAGTDFSLSPRCLCVD